MPARTRQIRFLREAYGEFTGHATPQLLAGALVLLLCYRLLRADWSATDLVVVAALMVLQPLTEWLIHVLVLHCPADGGLRDRLAGNSHRRHHEDPKDLRFQFIHPGVTGGGMLLGALLMAGTHSPTVVTGVLTATVLTGAYEWVHFLIHTDYAPRHEPYRRLHRAHRLHHFRNERYWLGVTSRLGDQLLGTNPDKDDVEVSPTARTALAAR